MKKYWIIGVIAITLCFLSVYFYIQGDVKYQSTSSSLGKETSSSKAKELMSEETAKREVYTTLQAISSALKEKDQEKFHEYMDVHKVCDSLVGTLFKAFEAFIGGEVKDKAINQCVDEFNGYASGTKSEPFPGAASTRSLYSLEELFQTPTDIEIVNTSDTITAFIKKSDGNIGFGFENSGKNLRLTSVQIGYSLKTE